MLYCSNCGQPLAEGSKFCHVCGADIATENHSTSSATRNTVYEGELHKCPNCGEVLNAFVTVCPTCGHELRGTKAAQSIHDFASKLEAAQTDEQRVSLIRSYPIPNSKEDIFEFLILASTNIVGEQQKNIFEAWSVKFEQSYQKAKLSFGNDLDFEKTQKLYSQTLKKINAQRAIHNAKLTGNFVTKVAAAMPNPVFGITVLLLLIFEIIRVFNGNFAGFDIIFCVIILRAVYKISEKKAGKATPKGHYNQIEQANTEAIAEISQIKLPSAIASGCESKNYAVVEAMLSQAGFTNVRAVPLNDLSDGLLGLHGRKKSGLVESISIEGKPLSSYVRRKFNSDAAIIINYHCVR